MGLALVGCGMGPTTLAYVELCDDNEYVSRTQCVRCPDGSTNDAGDLRSGPDTGCRCEAGLVFEAGSCVPRRCLADQRVANGECEPCPEGTFAEARAPADGPDTTCAPRMCAVDERVDNFACVPCPDGSTQPSPGDTASGPSTCVCPPGSTTQTTGGAPCQSVRCGMDQRVRSNACEMCPAGTRFPEGGAPATGPNTECDSDPCFAAVGVACRDARLAYLKASPAESFASFGASVAFDGRTVAVGAPNTGGVGSVEIFGLSDDQPSVQARLSPPNPEPGGRFGAAVGVDADVLAVGAPGEGGGRGAIYIYVRTGTTWSPPVRRTLLEAGSGDVLGTSVAVSGEVVAAGAPGAGGHGGVAFFELVFGTWTLRAFAAAATPQPGEELGASVALAEGGAIAGAPGATVGGAVEAGRAIRFERTQGQWRPLGELLVSSAPRPQDRFGHAVALSNTAALVGVPGADSGGSGEPGADRTTDAGAAFWFDLATGAPPVYLESPNPGPGDRFGSALALDGRRAAIGAPFEDGSAVEIGGGPDRAAADAGAVWLFEQEGPMAPAYVKAFNTRPGDRFGAALALSSGRLVVGAPGESGNASGIDGAETSSAAEGAGAAYIWRVAP